MEFLYIPSRAAWVKGIEDLISEYGRPFKRTYSPDESAKSDIMQELLCLQDPEFMLEHTRQHREGILLVDESAFEYFECLMTQVTRAEDLHDEINRLHQEVGDDPAADPLWEAYEDRVRTIEKTAEWVKERPADTLELINRVGDKYTTALKNYLAEREGL